MSQLSHLDALEAEAIYIIREVAAECEKPVMLYSIGKLLPAEVWMMENPHLSAIYFTIPNFFMQTRKKP